MRLRITLITINLAIVLTLFLAVGPVNGQDFPDGLIGISSTEPAILYSIDEATGHATPIVTLDGYASIAGLAFLQRTLYGTDLGGFPGSVSSENWGKMEKVDTRSRIKYKDGGVQDEGDSTGKVHEGVSRGSGKTGDGREHVIA